MINVKQIIKEAMEKNPVGLKESLEEELRGRVALALEAKMKETHHDDDDEDPDEELTEDKFSDFWGKVFSDLDFKMKKFDDSKVSDVNKVSSHIRQSIPKIPQSKAMLVAVEYADYRSGAKTRARAIDDIKKNMSALQKKESINGLDIESLYESHFEVGDKVKCIDSGTSGEVVKLDTPEVGKYYSVKKDSGKVMKYSSDELELISKSNKEK